MQVQEHEFEAEHGLPEALPAGERLLWQGAPDWRVLAIESLHVRKIAIYFGVLMAWRMATVVSEGGGVLQVLASMTYAVPLALLALGLLAGCAWLIAHTTVYTLTDRRVVMRVGIVLCVTFNLPFRSIESAGLRERADGHGDITLVLTGPDRIAYLHLWPHVRPWQLKRTQPMLRALPQARQVAQMLADALAQSAGVATAPLAAPEIAAQEPRASAGRPMATA